MTEYVGALNDSSTQYVRNIAKELTEMNSNKNGLRTTEQSCPEPFQQNPLRERERVMRRRRRHKKCGAVHV